MGFERRDDGSADFLAGGMGRERCAVRTWSAHGPLHLWPGPVLVFGDLVRWSLESNDRPTRVTGAGGCRTCVSPTYVLRGMVDGCVYGMQVGALALS